MAQTKAKLQKTKDNPNDELYTQMPDISHELDKYKQYLKGKRIISPCDWDGPDSCNFINFLDQVKDDWGIQSFDWSGYNPADPENTNGVQNFKKFQEVDYNLYDVVITNPPFSLFREFVAKLMEYPHLKFIIIGPMTAISYKEIAKLIISHKIWLGNSYPKVFHDINNQPRKFGNICWWTNLPTVVQNQWQIFTESYYNKASKYQKADNMDVLVIDRIKDIPFDYAGPMAVPTSFLIKWNPDQFIIYNISRYYTYGFDKSFDLVYKGKTPFMKLIIQHKKPVKTQEEQYE